MDLEEQYDKIYRYCYFKLYDKQLAQDMTQEITAVIVSILVMVLSEMLQSNITALAVSTGFLILPIIVQIPMQYRVLAQIWDWFP